jgi:NTP pyrophosphatase (non-canonical NTP hydrolase)
VKEVNLTVHTFRMGDDKEAALKPLEEAAEIFGAWQTPNENNKLANEIADCIQACVNLADREGVDLEAALKRVESGNRARGRY